MCILTVFTRESTAGSVRKTTLHRAPVGGIEKLIVHGLCVLYLASILCTLYVHCTLYSRVGKF